MNYSNKLSSYFDQSLGGRKSKDYNEEVQNLAMRFPKLKLIASPDAREE